MVSVGKRRVVVPVVAIWTAAVGVVVRIVGRAVVTHHGHAIVVDGVAVVDPDERVGGGGHGFPDLVGVAEGEVDHVLGITETDDALLDFLLGGLVHAREDRGLLLDAALHRLAARGEEEKEEDGQGGGHACFHSDIKTLEV